MQLQEKTSISMEALGRRMDAIIKLELYSIKLGLKNFRNAEEKYREIEESINSMIND